MEYRIYKYIISSYKTNSLGKGLFIIMVSNLIITGNGLALTLVLSYTFEYFNIEFSLVPLTIGCVFMMTGVFVTYMDKLMDRMDERDVIWNKLGGRV